MNELVTAEQRAAIRALGAVLPADAYLAGGVAIAATLHHRASRDVDFFVSTPFDAESLGEELTAQIAGILITGTAPGTLYLEVGGVPASVIQYRYPQITEPAENEALAVRVASLEDLACMKLSAIASRGLARDFWDLHALLHHGVADGDLGRALALFRRKFASDDIGHVVRSLAYFADADAAPLPAGLSDRTWGEIKRDFERWVLALSDGGGPG